MLSTATLPFVIYNASAGSGKTHTLVRSFLFQLLNSDHPEQVRRLLAITFTNKAAKEMKSRILTELAGFATSKKPPKEDTMFSEVAAMCNLNDDQLHQRSKKALRYILHHFGQLQVATIDKLTHKIIRTFARDLGINARFEVALDGKSFMAEVVEQVLSKAGEDKVLTQVLVNYVLQKSDDLKSWDVTKQLNTIAQMYLNENHMQSLSDLKDLPIKAFVDLNQKLKIQIATILTPIQSESKEIILALERLQIPSSLFPFKSLPRLLTLLSHGECPKQMLNTTLSKSLETKTFLKKSATNEEQDKFDRIKGQVISFLQTYKQYWRQLVLLDLLCRNVVPLSLMQHIGESVTALQDDRNTQLLGFFNKLISDAIKDTDTDFMFERLGVRFQHFFVDEFQDTSSLQWANLQKLFSHAIEDREGQGSLVLVGDAKQSIYRWRGGHPEQFMKLANKQSPFAITPDVENLPKNFRSLPNIVSFNNDFFTKASVFLPLSHQQALYAKSCKQEQGNSKAGGYVTISTIVGSNKDKRTEAYQTQVLSRVKDCMEQGYNLKDISVLVRKNNQGMQVAKVLTEAGIQVTSSESLLVAQSSEVQFLINLVKLRVAPKSKINRYAVLEHFAFLQPNPFEWTAKQTQRPLRHILLSLSNQKFDLTKFNQLPIYAALEYAVWSLSLITHLTAHVQAFLDEILKWQGKGESTPIELISHWELNKDNWTVRPPENRNAVKIMTIHKAKGLAFPVVILPFSDSKWNEGNNNLAWFPLPHGEYTPFKEMLLPISQNLTKLGEGANQTYQTYYAQSFMDTLNTLYVGMTRPVEELHIITQKGKIESTPKGLPDIFSKAFPDLNNQAVTYGARKKHASKTLDLIVTTPPFTFNYTHATNVVSERPFQSKYAHFGNVLHEVMALVDVPQDLDGALSQSNAKERLGEKQYEQLYKRTHEMVVHNELKAFFDPANTPYKERSLFASNGRLLRPDRFIISPDKNALLLDYKTGQYHESHKYQLEEYAKCLSQQGFIVTQKLLVYCGENLVLKEV